MKPQIDWMTTKVIIASKSRKLSIAFRTKPLKASGNGTCRNAEAVVTCLAALLFGHRSRSLLYVFSTSCDPQITLNLSTSFSLSLSFLLVTFVTFLRRYEASSFARSELKTDTILLACRNFDMMAKLLSLLALEVDWERLMLCSCKRGCWTEDKHC